ncbi:unnamed protein product [Acanthoscelides obtectus]|uniref:DUF5641 domain-containing protein n=1 Tax=Acanthoscelides obtectus TaxID=200917 RepID=A0A9P0QCC4_ACAOB|nr:unnamed protein product [Acanthoscelides obtectus]CAK1686264.1 hypothetical protein AOBTE_LOCUS35884 [Acanthoscelides obtectus]
MNTQLHNIHDRALEHVTVNELERSFTFLIRLAQQEAFSEEISSLQKNRKLQCNNRLVSLNPFIDECGIMRVGGRLTTTPPPAKWRLGRVIQLSPGTDGVTRVATLKTENGMTSRAINRLVPLPVVHPQDSQGPGHVCATPLAKWVSTISRRSAPPSSAQPTTADRKTVEF